MKRKAVSCMLVLAALVTMIPTIPTIAAENQDNETPSTQTTTETGTQNSVVKYDQASAFTVTIPKSIALSSSKSAEYTVKVQGDVIGNEIITVTPDASVILSDSNSKDPVTGDITQEKTEFSSTEVNARSGGGTATGSILANNLTSGDWSGNFKFVIGTNQIGNGTAITSENLATYGIKTTGDVVIPEYVTDDDNTRHAVTGIGDYAFRDCNEMTSVTIADSVTEIGTGAFVNCSKLSRAAVPNSVRSIGNSAFDGCTSLSSISYNGNEYDLSNIEPAFVKNGVSVGSHVFEHSYSEPVYTWSENNSTCTATKTCSECHDIITETADVSTKTTDATCTDEGLNTYTATFKNSDFKTQTKTSKISAKGHKSVSANNAVAATCTTDGKESDTVCSVCGVTLATGKTIEKTGHKYGTPTYTWSKDGKTCVAKRVCANNGTHIETESATITNKVKTPAMCTVKGTRTYTATFKNTAFKTQAKDIQDIAALGHKYGTPTYTWSNDGKTCIAKRVCANEGTHIETENGTITNKVKTPATYTTKGTTTYTATFKNTAFKAQTKDIQNIPVLEKLTGSVVLSATSGTISYPAAGSFTITSNKSNGTLSVKSSDPNVATAALDGNTVTVIPGTTAGSAVITVTSAATTSYKAASANYNVTVKSGTLPITAKAYSGTYDGKAHSASVTSSVSGVTFKYGTVKGTYNLSSMPTYTNAGTYVVYYQATKAGYTTFEGSVKTVIQKKATTTSLSSANGVLYVTTTGNGTITAQSSDSNIIESVTVNDKTITYTPKQYGNAGTATITVTVGETMNYKASSATCKITVSDRLINNSSLSYWHPAYEYEFGYLNESGQYVVDSGSTWHCMSLIPVTTSGYYYIVGYSGGAPRFCLYNDNNRNSLYQSFKISGGYYTYIPAGKYLGTMITRDGSVNELDLRLVTVTN